MKSNHHLVVCGQHARQNQEELPFHFRFCPNSSSHAIFNAFLNGPRKELGTPFMRARIQKIPRKHQDDFLLFRSHCYSSHFLFEGFVLSKCLQPSFPSFLIAQPLLRILVLPMVLFLTLMGHNGGDNQRNVETNREVACTHAEYVQVRKLRPDAFPDGGLV